VICGHCSANLKQENRKGETLLRNRGVILKSDGLVFVCPKCKGDVRLTGEMLGKIKEKILFFKQKLPA